MVSTMIPLNGEWSTAHAKVTSLNTPRMYYFMMLDCPKEVHKTIGGNKSEIYAEVHFTTGQSENEFSYEDIGSLRLYMILFISFGVLFALMLHSFNNFYNV